MRLPCHDAFEALEAALAASPSTTTALAPVLATLKAAVAPGSTNNNLDATSSLVASLAKQLIPVAAALAAAGTKTAGAGAAAAAGAAGAAGGAGFVKVVVKSEAGAASTSGAGANNASLYDPKDVLCSTSSPISFSTPRGKFDVHCLKDSFVLESTTPKVGGWTS